MSKFDLFTIFPKTLCISQEPGIEVDDEFISKINGYEFSHNEGNETSVRFDILEDETFDELRDHLTRQLNHYFHDILKVPEQVGFRFVTSWLNRTESGGYHHWHNHPNSFVSGVVNFTEANTVEFSSSQTVFPGWMPDYEEVNIHNAENLKMVMQKPGSSVIFPSSLMHSVPAHHEETTRLSLSFNVMLTGPVCTRGVNTLTI